MSSGLQSLTQPVTLGRVVLVEDVELALDQDDLHAAVEVNQDLPVLDHAAAEVTHLAFLGLGFAGLAQKVHGHRQILLIFSLSPD